MPAKLTRVGQSSTSTGTGNFTLGAALTSLSPAIRTFADVVGVNNAQFFYSILHKTLNEYEDGIGYMSDSTTLVRHKIFRSSNSNAVVNFSAGDKDVMCADQGNLQDMYFGGSPATSTATKWQIPNNQAGGSSTVAITANRIYAIPMVVTSRIRVTEFMCAVTTGSAGSVVRAALAERVGLTSYKVFTDLGEIDSATTGDKAFTGGTGVLPAGNYYMLVHSSGNPTVRSRAINYADLGSAFGSATQWVYGSLTWPGSWPSEVTGVNNPINNSAAPTIFYRTEDDY